MINSIIFVTDFIWFNIIRDTLLMFEQFLYVILLSSLVPGSFFFMDWILNWLSGYIIWLLINIILNVCSVGGIWNTLKIQCSYQNTFVFGINVVGEHLKLLMVNYIGGKKIKIMLDLYRLLVLYLGINDGN